MLSKTTDHNHLKIRCARVDRLARGDERNADRSWITRFDGPVLIGVGIDNEAVTLG